MKVVCKLLLTYYLYCSQCHVFIPVRDSKILLKRVQYFYFVVGCYYYFILCVFAWQ